MLSIIRSRSEIYKKYFGIQKPFSGTPHFLHTLYPANGAFSAESLPGWRRTIYRAGDILSTGLEMHQHMAMHQTAEGAAFSS